MSGVLRRTALMCRHKNGIYDSGWRRVVTSVGSCMEPTPFSSHESDTRAADITYGDQISHVDDLDWIPYGNPDILSGTTPSVEGSADGWWLSGGSLVYAN